MIGFTNLLPGVLRQKDLVTNFLATIKGKPLDATMGKQLKDEIDGINSDLGGTKIITEGSGAATKYYAQLGADTASKKLLGGKPILLGTATGDRYAKWTFDVKAKLSNYKSLTIDNFMFVLESVRLQAANTADAYLNFTASYNPETGIITETSAVSCSSPANGTSTVKIYYVP